MTDQTRETIRQNLELIKERILIACERAGRDPDQIKLVAVSKTVSAEVALQAVEAGVTDLGENRAQDILTKHDLIGNRADWHFVGHLQRNKIRKIIDFVDLIHSVDNLPLASEINHRAKEINKIQKILIEVNISGEISKYGLRPDEVFAFIKQVAVFDNLKFEGLMTMAPLGCSVAVARDIFRKLRELGEELKQEAINVNRLSMGMSDDFEPAIEEGANIVRIGRAIFR